jgi:hypothetical protein
MPTALTYNSALKQDGPGAQYQRIIGIMAVAWRCGFKYIHTPPQAMVLDAVLSDGNTLIRDRSTAITAWEEMLGLKVFSTDGFEDAPVDYISSLTPEIILDRTPGVFAAAFPGPLIDTVPDWQDLIMPSLRTVYRGFKHQNGPPDVVLHIRRGDVGPGNHAFTHTGYYEDAINIIRERRPGSRFDVYSERSICGDDEFHRIEADDVTMHIDGDPLAAFHAMATAKVLVAAKSSFSYVASLYNANCVVYQHWIGAKLSRWHYLDELTEHNCR